MTQRSLLLVLVVAMVAALCGCNRNNIVSQKIAPSLPDVAFCDAVAKPAEFDGQMIRLHANFSRGKHGATVGDSKCIKADNITWVKLSAAKWDELSRAAETAYGVKNVGAFDLVAVGKFSRNRPSGESDSLEDTAPFQFELLSVEKVVPPS